MDDEFALCWNNFQDNIASGFQNLYDRGDLVDVTIACDGKLLHAHKIVLAICSPYFQEMFIVNPCKHPIIILKDVSYNVMCELLQFMYQGVVNVKHTELSTFMKIAQTLQVKGLATSTSSHSQKSPSHNHHHHHQQQQHQHNIQYTSTSNNNNNNHNNKNGGNGNKNSGGNNIETTKINSLSSYSPNTTAATNSKNLSSENQSSSAPSSSSLSGTTSAAAGTTGNGNSSGSLKRNANDFFNSVEGLSIFPRKQMKRFSIENNNSDTDINNDSMDNMNSSDDAFLPPIPQISMIESRFDLNSVKRESNSNHDFIIGNSSTPNSVGSGGGGGVGGVINCSGSLRNTLPPPFNFEYGMYAAAAANKSMEYPNELHIGGDYSKNLANHVDIPSVAPGERWFHGKLEFMLSQRGKPLLVYDGHTFGIQYIRKDKKYWQCNLSRKFNCKARVTTTESGEIIVTNNEHCHTEIRQHLRKDYHRNKFQTNINNNNNNNSSSQMNKISATTSIGIASATTVTTGTATDTTNNSNNTTTTTNTATGTDTAANTVKHSMNDDDDDNNKNANNCSTTNNNNKNNNKNTNSSSKTSSTNDDSKCNSSNNSDNKNNDNNTINKWGIKKETIT